MRKTVRPWAAPLKWVSRWTLTSCASNASTRDRNIAVLLAIISLRPETSRLPTSSRTSIDGVEALVDRLIFADQRARRFGDLQRADHLSARLARLRPGEDRLRVGEELRADGPVVQQGRRLERRGIARRQHRQLVIDFLPLFRQQPLEQRILDDRQVDGVKVALRRVGVDGQRPVTEFGRFLLAVGEEALHRLAAVDRRDRQQEIEASRDLVELLVGVQRRGEERAPAERAEMRRRAGAAARP